MTQPKIKPTNVKKSDESQTKALQSETAQPKTKPSKAISLMGFAARARKVMTGYNTAKTTVEKGRGRLIVVAEDLSENSKDKIKTLARQHGVPYEEYGTVDELGHITGKDGSGIFVITDTQFAEAIAKAIRDTLH